MRVDVCIYLLSAVFILFFFLFSSSFADCSRRRELVTFYELQRCVRAVIIIIIMILSLTILGRLRDDVWLCLYQFVPPLW